MSRDIKNRNEWLKNNYLNNPYFREYQIDYKVKNSEHLKLKRKERDIRMKDTINAHKREANKNKPKNVKMWENSKARAKRKGWEFTIKPEDIVIPEYCPILGLKLKSGDKWGLPSSPSLDRIDNTKYYIPGNVCVISFQANRIKSEMTFQQIENLYNYIKKDP